MTAPRQDSWLARCSNSIRHRLMAWGLGLLATALLINTIAGSLYTRGQLLNAIGALQSEVASTTAHRIESLVARRFDRLEDAGSSMALNPLGSAAQRSVAFALLRNDPAFSELRVLSSDGQEILRVSDPPLFLGGATGQQVDSRAVATALDGRRFLGVINSTTSGQPFLSLAVPLLQNHMEVVGILIAKVNLVALREIFTKLKLGSGGYAYLIDQNAHLIAPPDVAKFAKPIDQKILSKAIRTLPSLVIDQNPAQDALGINGERVLTTYARIPKLNWAVVVEEPARLALAELNRVHRYGGMLLIFGLLLGASLIVWVSGKITKPIQDLREGVAIISQGDLEHRVRSTSDDEIGQLASEFNKMAGVLSSSYATLEQKVERRTGQISALYEVTKTVNRSLDLEKILQEVVERITQIFDFDTTRIYLFDGNRQNLLLRGDFVTDADPWTGIELFPQRRGIVGRVAETGEAIIFDDVQSDPRYAELSASHAAGAAGFHFLAVFPVKIQNRSLGALAIGNKDKRLLAEDELRMIASMCAQVAASVEKVQLFDQVMARSSYLEMLNTIGASVSESLDLDVVLQRAVQEINAHLGFDAAWICQLSGADQQLHLRAEIGLADKFGGTMQFRPIDAGIGGHVFESGQRLVFDDLKNDELYRSLTKNGDVQSLGFAAAAVLPIKSKEKIIGTLHVASRKKRHFKVEELDLLQSISHQIGVATENAMLFAEINEKTKELAHTNQELIDATRAKAEFIAAMSHELRTPLNIVIGSSDLMRDGFFGDLSAGQKGATDKISRNARVLLKMINDVLTISRFDAERICLDLATIEVDEIIEQTRTLVEQVNRDKRLDFRWVIDSNIPPMVTDSLKLEEILQNLIGNAFKFTPNGYIELRVQHRPELDRVEFSVADTGIGIAGDDLGRIFNAFEQIKDAHTGHFNGVGLGLNIVRRYLDLMKGEISVESEPGEGTKFTFTVPRSIQLNS